MSIKAKRFWTYSGCHNVSGTCPFNPGFLKCALRPVLIVAEKHLQYFFYFTWFDIFSPNAMTFMHFFVVFHTSLFISVIVHGRKKRPSPIYI